MKNKIASVILVIVAMVGSASAVSYNGDLLAGFTTQSGNDLIYDLGSASSLTGPMSWDLSSLLSGYDLSGIKWGVIGDKTGSPRTAWSTTIGLSPLSISGNTAWATLDTPTKSIYQNFTAAGAGQSLFIDSNDDNSWNQQTISGTLNTQYHNAYENPNVTSSFVEAALYQVKADGTDPTLAGIFHLSNAGVLTFAVPEPSTYSLLAGAGVLVALWRGRFSRKQA